MLIVLSKIEPHADKKKKNQDLPCVYDCIPTGAGRKAPYHTNKQKRQTSVIFNVTSSPTEFPCHTTSRSHDREIKKRIHLPIVVVCAKKVSSHDRMYDVR